MIDKIIINKIDARQEQIYNKRLRDKCIKRMKKNIINIHEILAYIETAVTCQEKIITIANYVLLFFKTFLSISFKTLLFIQ